MYAELSLRIVKDAEAFFILPGCVTKSVFGL